eukprot:TRINITY_DN65970_c0_g1_i1.p1 TRINITY_DN65970_c0_g1~~TRINITY_DN65970_c0_g1_i1.p1  ORF type:complete len:458 (-),score=100.15 TRINITY_DN65970_c0_g1_i1:122-1495(-)
MTFCGHLLFGVVAICLLPIRQAIVGRGHCLGDCSGCLALLDSLPREPRASAKRHLDASRAGPEEVFAFLNAPEVCQVDELFPVSLDREFWSLAALTGGPSRLSFSGGQAAWRLASNACSNMRAASVDAYVHALRAASDCAGSFTAGAELLPPRCGAEGVRSVADALAAAWLDKIGAGRPAGSDAAASAEGGFVAQVGNETRDIVAEYAARIRDALGSVASIAAPESASGAENRSQLFSSYGVLTDLAMDLARHTRLMMEHLRLAWGVKLLAAELSGAYPNIQAELPPVAFRTEVYGRHFDVLENLLLQLQAEQPSGAPLRMAEMGVACGPIGYYLLQRFPDMSYAGADPTIRNVVVDAYSRFGPRAKLHAITSEELHDSLPEDAQFDFVFIDGPHTYRNVRNDIAMWQPRVRPGGIIAGHDFTCAHPPLLWAVLEARMQGSGETVNVGPDGVWWWRV